MQLRYSEIRSRTLVQLNSVLEEATGQTFDFDDMQSARHAVAKLIHYAGLETLYLISPYGECLREATSEEAQESIETEEGWITVLNDDGETHVKCYVG